MDNRYRGNNTNGSGGNRSYNYNTKSRKGLLVFMIIIAIVLLGSFATVAVVMARNKNSSPDNNNNHRLDTPALSLSGKQLYWNSVQNAESYDIDIDGQITRVSNATSYSLTGLTTVKTYTIKVKANGNENYVDSNWSNSVSYVVEDTDNGNDNKLQTPTLSLSGNQLSWNSIQNAGSYDIDIDGQITNVNTTSYSLSGLTQNNTYIIKVKANGSNGYADSDWSNTVYYVVSDIVGPTSPDAVEQRFKNYISREYYEQLFPNRFGTRNWKDDIAEVWAFYPDKEFRESRTDYYSYDNFITALRTLAAIRATFEWVDGVKYLVQTENTTNGQIRIFDNPSKRKSGIREVVEYGDFLNSSNENDNRRELSALLAHLSKESGAYTWVDPNGSYVPVDKYTWGLAFNEETAYIGNTGDTYSAYDHLEYPPVKGHSYHGRGPIQLTWNYNYGFFSELIFGDKNVLLQNPERVSEEGELGIMSAIWFWMTPQAPKASCHDIMLNYFVPDATGSFSVYYNCFGLTIVVVNGKYEADKYPSEWPQVATRIDFYKRYTSTLGANIDGEKLDTKGFPPWGEW